MPSGAVSWWRAEGDASDSAGNNNGVLAGDATYGTGHSGKSFVFDGDRDGVMVGIGTNLHLQSFTIEAWIKRASASTPSFNGNSNAALFVVGTDPGGLGLSIRSSDNRLVLGKASAASVSSDARVADTNWHHVAVTRHDRRVVFYLDGEAAPAPEFDANEFTYAAPAYIGSWYNRAGLVDNSFYGSIDEVAIYDRRLSAPEILAIYEAGRAGKCPVTNRPPSCITPAPGLLSWWRAEDNAFDSAEANHGDLVGKVAYTSGKVGKALRFEATGSGVCVGNPVGLQLQDFSIEVWLRLANPSMPAFESNITASIFSLGSVGDGFGFYLRTNGLLGFGKANINEAVSTARISDTNWHHVVLTRSGASVIFYVDAMAYPAASYDSGRYGFHGAGYIGARLNPFSQMEDSFNGVLDEIVIYSRPLSAAEVLGQFNAGSAGKCLMPAQPRIIVQPKSQTVTEGDHVTQTVAVTGSPPLSYQWRRYGIGIGGADEASLLLPAVRPVDAGTYSVFITNMYGTAASSEAVLEVAPLPDCASLPPGLASWWGGESNAVDVITENGGTLVNQAGFALGRVGLAFSFNGDNQLVQFPDTASLNPANALTLECWFYLEQYSTNDGVVIASKDDPANNVHQYGFGLINFTGEWTCGALLELLDGMVLAQGTTPIIPRRWYHLAMTYDESALRIYVDGELDRSVTAVGPVKNSSLPFRIGGHPNGPWGLNGRVDELSLYHRALTPAEIRSIYLAGGAGKCPPRQALNPPPSGMIGWWSAESNVVDSISGVSGVALNGAGYAPGKVATGFCFNGENQLVSMTNTASIRPTNELTLDFWVNVEAFPTNSWLALVAKSDPGSSRHQYALGMANVSGEWVVCGHLSTSGGQVLVNGSGGVSTQAWHHVALTYDRSTIRIYLNGVLEASVAVGDQIATGDFPLLIGSDGSGNSSFKGRLDEICLYSRALSSKDIAVNYLAGRVGKSLTDPPPSSRDLRKWLFSGNKTPSE